MPFWLYLICGFALFMTGSSFTGFGTFGLGLMDQGPGGPALVSNKGAGEEVKNDPITLGKKGYGTYCASCHTASGEGQPGKYPPLASSEWVNGSKQRLLAIVLHGLSGPVTVRGASFPGTDQMAAWSGQIPNAQIANILTYLRASWGNTANPVTEDEVNTAQTKFASQTAPWCEADLLKVAPHGPDPTDKK